MKHGLLIAALAMMAMGVSCQKDKGKDVTPTQQESITKTAPGLATVTINPTVGTDMTLAVNVTYLGADTTTSNYDYMNLYVDGQLKFGRTITGRMGGSKHTITSNPFSKSGTWKVYLLRDRTTYQDTILVIDGK